MKDWTDDDIRDALHQTLDTDRLQWGASLSQHVRNRTRNVRPRRWPWAVSVLLAAGAFGLLGHYLFAQDHSTVVGPKPAVMPSGHRTHHPQVEPKSSTQGPMTSATLTIASNHYQVLVPLSAKHLTAVGAIYHGFLYWAEPPRFNPASDPQNEQIGVPESNFIVYRVPQPQLGSTIRPYEAQVVGKVPLSIPGQSLSGLYNFPDQIMVTKGGVIVTAANTKSGMNQPYSDPVYLLRSHKPAQLLAQLHAGGGDFYAISAGQGYVVWLSATDALTPSTGTILGTGFLYNIATNVTESIPVPNAQGIDVSLNPKSAIVSGVTVPLNTVPKAQWTPGTSPVPQGALFPADWPTQSGFSKTTAQSTAQGLKVTLYALGLSGPAVPEITLSEGSLAHNIVLTPAFGTIVHVLGIPVTVFGSKAWWKEGGYHYQVSTVGQSAAGSITPSVTLLVKRIMEELPPWGNPGGRNTTGNFVAQIDLVPGVNGSTTSVTVSFHEKNGSGLPITIRSDSISSTINTAASLVH